MWICFRALFPFFAHVDSLRLFLDLRGRRSRRTNANNAPPFLSLSIFTRCPRLVFPYPLPFMGGEKEALLFVYPAKMTPPPPPTTLPTTTRQKRECFSRPNWRHSFLPIFFPKVPPPRSLFPLRPTVPHWIWRQEEGAHGKRRRRAP